MAVGHKASCPDAFPLAVIKAYVSCLFRLLLSFADPFFNQQVAVLAFSSLGFALNHVSPMPMIFADMQIIHL